MHWYTHTDGNFVEQFQTTGFDGGEDLGALSYSPPSAKYGLPRKSLVDRKARGSLEISHVPGSRRRILCGGDDTVNESGQGPRASPPSLDTKEGFQAFTQEFMPLKYGSAAHTQN